MMTVEKEHREVGLAGSIGIFSAILAIIMTVHNPDTGTLQPLIAPVKALFEEFTQMIREGIAIETAVRIVSTNVADHLCLFEKGRIVEGGDADLLLLSEDELSLHTVIARGEIMFEKGRVIKRGLFEEQ